MLNRITYLVKQYCNNLVRATGIWYSPRSKCEYGAFWSRVKTSNFIAGELSGIRKRSDSDYSSTLGTT